MKKLSLIAAVCQNGGIGIKGDLPWHLKAELKYFSRMTKKVNDSAKRNAIIMGRKTYFGVPEAKRPLSERLNIVLTRDPTANVYPAGVMVCTSMQEALDRLDQSPLVDEIETIWIVGGNAVYKEAMESDRCHRLYITDVKGTFNCDAFFPEITSDFKLVKNDADVPEEIQEENGIQYQYKIYEKC
ncbi:dihydrofolate reductase [Culex quinquefasciatus]|uniref:dihydrofolate reductase n=1 Tax=Culex quinquefasciatus TaxID=7176 RepID=B0X1Y0_CULQU|nr:dihydrofolate reductase [Culex quinquefasciatus]EDS38910.1 dihydrofolate reductase [Culex quinquefasciatus]|eukprot:XP_001863652.1 dihydrofolate reductase [Culex quinquefasciatus]